MVFSLSNRALDIFESSEANEKRQLLSFLLQNCRLSGKNLLFELQSPFNTILEHAHDPILLPLADELGTLDWGKIQTKLSQINFSQIKKAVRHAEMRARFTAAKVPKN